jgi:hypothetical protein
MIQSVPMRHTIITMGMADLGRTSPDLEQAGERRLRRKRSPRWQSSTQTLLGPMPEAWALKRGAIKCFGPFNLRIGGGHPFAAPQIWKKKVGSQLRQISLVFHGKSSNFPIDFVKIGAR